MNTLNATKTNPLQFAVVREDPRIEASVIASYPAEEPVRALLIGSGGCTAFHLQAVQPKTLITLLDANPAQCEFIRAKSQLLAKGETAALLGLLESGNFEALFRRFREFLYEFVAPASTWEKLFTESNGAREQLLQEIFAHKYWIPAFELHFHDAVLNAMFGPQATQHAPKGSYPSHFERALKAGLLRKDSGRNYFLQHIFLGRYLEADRPEYLSATPEVFRPLEIIQGTLENAPSLELFDVVSLSNIFDWMSETEIAETARLLESKTKPGCSLVIRQLNHRKEFENLFPAFRFQTERARDLHASDRSLFYTKLTIGVKK